MNAIKQKRDYQEPSSHAEFTLKTSQRLLCLRFGHSREQRFASRLNAQTSTCRPQIEATTLANDECSMEACCAELKKRGLYLNRCMPLDGVEVHIEGQDLTDAQIEIYDDCAIIWSQLYQKLLTSNFRDWKGFWGSHQRFFIHLLTCWRAIYAIPLAIEKERHGFSVVIYLDLTGNARTDAAAAEQVGRKLKCKVWHAVVCNMS